MTTGPDLWTPARKMARSIYSDVRDGFCRCHQSPDACGVHRLTDGDRYGRRFEAFILAARQLNLCAADGEIDNAVNAAAERFAKARR